jgi:hypothetical protein
LVGKISGRADWKIIAVNEAWQNRAAFAVINRFIPNNEVNSQSKAATNSIGWRAQSAPNAAKRLSSTNFACQFSRVPPSFETWVRL